MTLTLSVFSLPCLWFSFSCKPYIFSSISLCEYFFSFFLRSYMPFYSASSQSAFYCVFGYFYLSFINSSFFYFCTSFSRQQRGGWCFNCELRKMLCLLVTLNGLSLDISRFYFSACFYCILFSFSLYSRCNLINIQASNQCWRFIVLLGGGLGTFWSMRVKRFSI